MSSFRIRPRFEDFLEVSPDAAREQLTRALTAQPAGFEVKSFPGYICLRVPLKDRNFWSPRLTLSLEATPTQTTRVEGLYGPNANLWSLFLFGYLIIGSLGLFSGFLGIAQVTIESYPWGFYVCGCMAVAACVLYLIAQFGQKLGAWQTFQLHQAYQVAVGREMPIR